MTEDLLELYFQDSAGADIAVMTRTAVDNPFGAPSPVAELNTAAIESAPEVSGDGLTMFFASTRTPTLGGRDIWMATRASRTSPWDPPVHVLELSSAAADRPGQTTSDGLIMVFDSVRNGSDDDLFASTRTSLAAPWQAPVALSELNVTGVDDDGAALSADGLELYFGSARTGNLDLFVARRSSATSPFSSPEPVGELNTDLGETDPWISPDGRVLVFRRMGMFWISRR